VESPSSKGVFMGMGIGPSSTSAVITVQTLTVYTKPALLTNIMLHPGSTSATLTVYDNPSAGSGTILALLQGVANGATVIFPFDDSPPRANQGLTVTVTGTGAQAQIYYQPEN
jgi:hypothetical protein